MKWVEILANLLFWAISSWLLASSFSIQAQELELIDGVETVKIIRNEGIIWQTLLCVGLSMLAFYANFYSLGRLSHRTSRRRVILTSLLLLFCAIGVYLLMERIFFSPTTLPLPLHLSIGIFLFYLTVSSTYGMVKVLIRSEQKQKDLMLANKQAELTLLRNQLQPHFLFNALNNLLSFVDQQQSPQLASSFERLSQLLRYVIEESKSETVPISKEIAFLRNYCELQLLRFEEEEVQLQFSVKEGSKEPQLEPGLFIPFVENAFKYGTEPERQSRIEIYFDWSNAKELYFYVKNPRLSGVEKTERTGTGLSATKERLNLVYPGKHQLRIQEDDCFLLELTIETR